MLLLWWPSENEFQAFSHVWLSSGVLYSLIDILCLQVKHNTAVNLLFCEAYQNYLNSNYPCADQDVIILGGVLMQLNQGDYDARKAKNYFSK